MIEMLDDSSIIKSFRREIFERFFWCNS